MSEKPGDVSQGIDLTLYARKYTKRMIKALVKIVEDPTSPHTAIVAAAKEVLDRGNGKAPNRLNIVRQLDGNQLELLAKAILEKRERERLEIAEKSSYDKNVIDMGALPDNDDS